MLELDGECRDSRFILVQALDRDRVIALRPVGVSLLRWIDCVILSLRQGCLQPLFISVEMAVVRLDCEVYSYYLRCRSRELCPPLYSLGGKSPSRLQCRVLVGLQVIILLELHMESSNRTKSSPFLAGYPVGLASTFPFDFPIKLPLSTSNSS
jgi:hypothetical protein